MLNIPHYVETALSRLSEGGFEAFVVGGAVRDMLRGTPVHDYDITTSATPDEIKKIFSHCRIIETGILHGTLTVLIDGEAVEITTYRIDGGYTDMRHPDTVIFTRSLEEDAARRDFTVNAMAYHPANGVIDFFTGREDLGARLIRAVGDPHKRFKEDALRILRAVRFASVLDFTIEPQTEKAMLALRGGLQKVSPERVREELVKLLRGKAASRVLRQYREILSTIVPELSSMFDFDQKSRHHTFDLWEHTVRAVGAVKSTAVLRLAALLHDVGKPSCMHTDASGEGHFYGHAAKSEEIASKILARLRFDGKTRDAVLLLIRYHDLVPETKTRQLARLRSRFGEAFLFDWLALKRADQTAQKEILSNEKECALKEAEEAVSALLQKEDRIQLKNLKIGGDDLKKCGISPGKEMGALLSRALDGVLDGAVKNEKEALLSYLSLTPIECERKLLIHYPDKQKLIKMGAEKSDIEQTYLMSPVGVTERVRRRTFPGRTLYVYTKKIRISALSAKEYEEEITKEEYEKLLSRRDEKRKSVQKERFVLAYDKHILEIDVYPFWSRQAILEVELSCEKEDFSLPKEIKVIRDVSGEKTYKNAFLALKIPPEEI